MRLMGRLCLGDYIDRFPDLRLWERAINYTNLNAMAFFR